MTVKSDEILLRLFQRHLPDPEQAAARLRDWVNEAGLAFNPIDQLRELSYPSQPGLPNGLPSSIYYFVPGSGQGSELSLPSDPVNLSFLKGGDGIGLNLGCPLRLLRVVDALAKLPAADAEAPLDALRDPRNHLAAVEETLWITGWRADKVNRGGHLPGQAGDVDWRIESNGTILHLEAKFRRSDWARLVDYDTFFQAGAGFLSKALHKFPTQAAAGEIHIVGVTTFDDVSEHLLEAISSELLAAPQIHAVVIRSFLQMTHVLARDNALVERIVASLLVPDASTFPLHYPVIFHIEQRDQRRALRSALPPSRGPQTVHHWIAPANVHGLVIPEPAMYRMSLLNRAANGEPTFNMIPKYLWSHTIADVHRRQ